MAWLRLYDDIYSDHKVMQLDCSHFKSWVLCLGNAKRNGGFLSSIGELAFELRLREDVCQKHLDVLCEAGLLDIEDERYQPHNWNKFQYDSDNSTERSKRHREAKRNGKCNVAATFPQPLRNALRIQSTEIQNKTPLPPFVEPSLVEEKQTPEYWVEQLIRRHPKPAVRPLVEQQCTDHWATLGDAAKFAELMQVMYDSLAAWGEYWEVNGQQFAPTLQVWLKDRWWEKQPPKLARRAGHAPMLPTPKGKVCERCGGTGTVMTVSVEEAMDFTLAQIDAATVKCPACGNGP